MKEKSLKKGIKLDFKDIGAMEASMKILEEARTEVIGNNLIAYSISFYVSLFFTS